MVYGTRGEGVPEAVQSSSPSPLLAFGPMENAEVSDVLVHEWTQLEVCAAS